MTRVIAALLTTALAAQAQTPFDSLALAQGMPGQTTTPRTPARDPRPVTSTGSGIIRGQVVDATTGTPVRRANVTTYAPELRGVRPPAAVTDDDGRFELAELPPGKYTVNVNKTGFLGATYGQLKPRGPGTPIELADKQVVEKVVIKLARGGAIVGRVLDDAGEPMAEVQVQPLQYRYGPNGRTLSGANSGGWGRTDDLGAFRIYGLEPGQYYLSARPSDFMSSGASAPSQAVGPTTTYFPNAPDAGLAQRVTVAAGRDTGPVVITLVSAKVARVRGRAVMSDGQPFVHAQVMVTVKEGSGTHSRSSSTTAADGSFEIRSLTPGTYHISISPAGRANDDEDADIARATITVNGDDLDGLFMVAGRSGTARGRVLTDDGSPLPIAGMTVSASAPTEAERIYFRRPAPVREDGTFELKGLFGPQTFRSYVTGASTAPWTLKAVMLNGIDVIDRPIDFQAGTAIDGLELVFSQKFADLSGAVTADRGTLPPETWIILFPADEALWRENSRFVRAARPDKDGTYRFRQLPAYDNYLLVAATNLEPMQYMDPDFLREMRDRAIRLSVYDNEKKVQNIRMATSQ